MVELEQITCRSFGRPLTAGTENKEQLCEACSSYIDKGSLFKNLVYGMATGFFVPIEKQNPKSALQSALNYIQQLPYWIEMQNRGFKSLN
jgi:hypothetical protein